MYYKELAHVIIVAGQASSESTEQATRTARLELLPAQGEAAVHQQNFFFRESSAQLGKPFN